MDKVCSGYLAKAGSTTNSSWLSSNPTGCAFRRMRFRTDKGTPWLKDAINLYSIDYKIFQNLMWYQVTPAFTNLHMDILDTWVLRLKALASTLYHLSLIILLIIYLLFCLQLFTYCWCITVSVFCNTKQPRYGCLRGGRHEIKPSALHEAG